MRRIGGDYAADLAAHKSEWVTLSCAAYRGVELCELPQRSGFAALQMVNILRHAKLAQWPRDDPRALSY